MKRGLLMHHFDPLNRILACFTIIFATAILAAGLTFAEEGEKDWQPPPPMPDEWDWIQLISGEWLKGKIIAMYDENLEFDSDELDELTLDWGDIQEIRSGGTMQIGFQEDVVATGKLFVDGDIVRVMGAEDQSFRRSDLLTITAGAPKEINYWDGKITLGANIREGNTEQVEFSSKASFKRRTPKNRVNFDYLGNFNRTSGEWRPIINGSLPAGTVIFRSAFSGLRSTASTIAIRSRISAAGGPSAWASATR